MEECADAGSARCMLQSSTPMIISSRMIEAGIAVPLATCRGFVAQVAGRARDAVAMEFRPDQLIGMLSIDRAQDESP